MRKEEWTDGQIAVLMELYPFETTAHTAELLGKSVTAIKRKAGQLGLQKYIKNLWLERAEYVRNNFHDHSFSEIADGLNISRMSVARIATKLGLHRTNKERYHVTSRIRKDIIRRERRHVIFGLEPITRIKVVSNRARVKLRSVLKSKGYVVGEDNNVLYYSDNLKRREYLESRGTKLGLKFYPLPETDDDNSEDCNEENII